MQTELQEVTKAEQTMRTKEFKGVRLSVEDYGGTSMSAFIVHRGAKWDE